MDERKVLLEVKDVKKWFPVRSGLLRKTTRYVKAVDDVTMTVHAGETVGIVGESGCGKSTLARTILRLIEPTGGEIIFEGKDLAKVSAGEMHELRRDLQIVFQDPYASLNPRQRIGDMLTEPMEIHHLAGGDAARKKAEELLKIVGLPAESMRKFPHEFSGGQRQRLCIARALAVDPKLIVCDECVSALDVSIQAQIINLLMKLQRELGIALVFVTHDLRIVRQISDTIVVMYLGRVVEHAPTEELFAHPSHPYTKALLSAIPIPDPNVKLDRIVLNGELPSPIDIPGGCPFHTRCFMAQERCSIEVPSPVSVEKDHACSCLFAQQKGV